MAQARRIALLGLDRNEETSLRELFAGLQNAGDPAWVVTEEAQAEVLLIDLDSMYGQMSWLRAQGGPRPIVGLTAAPRADTHVRLGRPVTLDGLREALGRLQSASDRGEQAPAERAPPPVAPDRGPERREPEAPAASPVVDAATPERAPDSPRPTAAEAPPQPPTPPQQVPARPRDLRLLDYLREQRLPGPVRLRDAEPELLVDPVTGTWLGGPSLKPLLAIAAETIPVERWEAITPHEFERRRAQTAAQPLSRLLWLAGLGASPGRLLPELEGALRFRLLKYPATEREFPRHIRIATAMLKQPASPEEIAAASGQPLADVIDFINACAAIGLIEPETATVTGGEPEPHRGGLLGRLRRR
ncbi:MAG: hypothetical protein KatS3mg126_0133 [Lysobacteraceae bacterium]|nr:MAG: hypothetical protein KatS3mg126_0133 [Xanthomonadaceae bacterium]